MIKDITHYLTSADEGATRGAVTTEAEADVEGVVVAINTSGGCSTVNTINNCRGSAGSTRGRDDILDTTESGAIDNLLTTHILEESSRECSTNASNRGIAKCRDLTERVGGSRGEEVRANMEGVSKRRDSAVVRIVEGDLLRVRTDGRHFFIS